MKGRGFMQKILTSEKRVPAKSADFVGRGGTTERGELWDKMSRSERSEVCADESQRKGGLKCPM